MLKVRDQMNVMIKQRVCEIREKKKLTVVLPCGWLVNIRHHLEHRIRENCQYIMLGQSYRIRDI